jgi:hypothetical protein
MSIRVPLLFVSIMFGFISRAIPITLAMVLSPFPLSAQVGHDNVSQDSVSLATITTDTGDLAPGNTEFSRFTAPGMCVGAVHMMRDVARRSIAQQVQQVLHDTIMVGDTLPPAAVAVARRCMARFHVPTIPAATLPDLFTLALQAGADSVAQAVVARQLTVAADVAAKTDVLQAAVDGYLTAQPTRWAAATAAVAQIDASTVTADKKLLAHHALLSYAVRHWDVPLITTEAARLIAIGHSAPLAEVQYAWEPILWAYAALGSVAYVEAPDSVMAVMARAKADLGRYPPADACPSGHTLSSLIMLTHFKEIPVDKVRDVLLPFNARQYAGKPLPPVTASYWYPKPPDRWPPGKGRVSLVVYGGYEMGRCARSDEGLLNGSLSTNYGCRILYTWLPVWAQRYGEQLDMTLISPEEGTAARSVTLSPAAEADSVRWFYQEYLQLPVRIGVVRTALRQLPGVDGRVQRRDTTTYGNLHHASKWETHSSGDEVVVLYNAEGTLVYVGDRNWGHDLEDPVLRQLLDRELRTAGTSGLPRGAAAPRRLEGTP